MADLLQRRMSHFVVWIAPDPKDTPDTRAHAKDVLATIKNKGLENEIPIVDTLIGGSFEKGTGLRRHMRGDHEIEGQDIDLVFVVDHEDNEKYFTELVSKFTGLAEACYPKTEKRPTKCSVELSFVNPLVTYDLVPVYKTGRAKYQLLVRTDLERRLTSVELHTEFIKNRIKRSKATAGVVEFNECIRLLKWWRCQFQESAFYAKEIPSTVIELLFAHVFDQKGVQKNYAETLVQWLWAASSIVEKKTPIFFNDYCTGRPTLDQHGTVWSVIDPVNFENVVTKKWNAQQVQEFADGLKKAAANLQSAVKCNMFDNNTGSLEAIEKVFGPAIKHHCGDD